MRSHISSMYIMAAMGLVQVVFLLGLKMFDPRDRWTNDKSVTNLKTRRGIIQRVTWELLSREGYMLNSCD
ncbi:hypothetical protein DSO57_1012894 [Entomophthora muscae]|uniref:Uncharacterized protein n=1 Tax=Entomophthora muscae TaxID=34485 RepID=A0ACC2SIV4_9FUNG|nr:hypothetical protein DSO57_1012894 [Entomophthora muscae]